MFVPTPSRSQLPSDHSEREDTDLDSYPAVSLGSSLGPSSDAEGGETAVERPDASSYISDNPQPIISSTISQDKTAGAENDLGKLFTLLAKKFQKDDDCARKPRSQHRESLPKRWTPPLYGVRPVVREKDVRPARIGGEPPLFGGPMYGSGVPLINRTSTMPTRGRTRTSSHRNNSYRDNYIPEEEPSDWKDTDEESEPQLPQRQPLDERDNNPPAEALSKLLANTALNKNDISSLGNDGKQLLLLLVQSLKKSLNSRDHLAAEGGEMLSPEPDGPPTAGKGLKLSQRPRSVKNREKIDLTSQPKSPAASNCPHDAGDGVNSLPESYRRPVKSYIRAHMSQAGTLSDGIDWRAELCYLTRTGCDASDDELLDSLRRIGEELEGSRDVRGEIGTIAGSEAGKAAIGEEEPFKYVVAIMNFSIKSNLLNSNLHLLLPVQMKHSKLRMAAIMALPSCPIPAFT
ncbi:MAG: hypothetical protein M1813_002853 [Trichoglossum hirsutum]|nr:MAG: hypothetical protein M1813_002853 [Trichoglossum hirsutum]